MSTLRATLVVMISLRPARHGQYIATLSTALLNRKLSNECPVMAFHFPIKESSSPRCIYYLSLSLFRCPLIEKTKLPKSYKEIKLFFYPNISYSRDILD